MGGEWTTCTVADVAAKTRNAIVGGPFGSDLVSRDYVAVGVPVIRGTNMANRWVGGEFAFVSAEKSESLAANHAEPGDVVFTQRGTLGQVALVPEMPYARYLVSQSQMKLTVDRQKASPLFLYYVFRSEEQQEYIRKNAIQTGVPHTNLGLLKATPLVLPPLAEQRAIARILGALDDKIELNRRMNATLEAVARALFKSWFVDFDPVRAKAEGRAPSGMDAETAKLFPSEFVDSELGPIPMGWQVCKLGELLELKRGYDLPAAQRLPGRVPIVSSSGPTGVHDEAKVAGPGLVTGRYGTIGRVFLVREDFWPLNTTLYVRDLKRTHLHFAYHLLCGLDFEKFSDKAAVPGINRNHVHEEHVVAAPHEVQRRFEEVAGPWGRECERRATESTILARIRDELLPRLLSGAVSVASAEREAETVA